MRVSIGVLLLAIGVLVTPGASAQLSQTGSQTLPDADSPSGTVYEIPVEQGRIEAAPPGSRRGSDEPPAPVRSENNFGSSSSVPGADASSRSGNTGFGTRTKQSTKQVGASSNRPAESLDRLDAGSSREGDEPSETIALALLLLVVTAGVVLGRVGTSRRSFAASSENHRN